MVRKDSVWSFVRGRACVVFRGRLWSCPFLDGPVIRCRDNFFLAVNIFPAIRRAVIFDVDFVTNGGHCVNRTVHTHIRVRIFVRRSAISINITFCE